MHWRRTTCLWKLFYRNPILEANGWKMERFSIQIRSRTFREDHQHMHHFPAHRTVILNEGNTYRLKLKSLSLKDAGDISFQCGDVKDSCKVTVKECMSVDLRWGTWWCTRHFLGDKPPRIDASRFAKSVTVKAGRPLDLEIPYDAFPAPTMIWLKDGKPVATSDGLCQTTQDPRKCKLNM